MRKTLIPKMLFVALVMALVMPKISAIDIYQGTPLVDLEDSLDLEEDDDNCDPPSGNDGPNGGGGPCEKDSAPGSAVWRVSEPSLNLWLHDTPLRYRLSSGQWMELTLSYKQRGETREEFIGGFGPGWSCNWLGLVVRSNNIPQPTILIHKAGGGREIVILGGQSPRTQSHTVCCMAPCEWDSGVQIDSRTGSSRTYTNVACSPYPDVAYLLRSIRADRYGRNTRYFWAGFNTNNTCYARLETVNDRDGNTCTLAYTNAQFPQRITAVSDPYSRTARFFYDHLGRLTNITDTIELNSIVEYDQNGVVTNLHTAYGDTGFRHFESKDGYGKVLGRAIEISEPIGTKQLYVYRLELPAAAVGDYATHDFSNKTNRNSFHWDRAQYAALSDQARTNYLEMPSADFLKASLKHWLLRSDSSLSDTLAAQAGPLVGTDRVDQICYKYQGQASASTEGASKQITRINWNGTNHVSGVAHQVDIGRNTWGRPTNITFYIGNATCSYTNYFDPDGRILQRVIGPRNELMRGYGYDAVYTNLLTSVTNAELGVVRYTHDKTDRKMKLTSITYPSGLVTTNYYNSGFLERTTDQGIRTNSFGYQDGNVRFETNELDLVTTNTWDNLGRLLSTHYPDGSYTSNWWDKLDVVGVRDRMGYWTRYAYNEVRQRTFETNANGQVTRYNYCDCGSPSEIIVWNGTNPVTTVYQHDLAGRMTNIIYPDNYSLTYTFDALSRLERITDSANGQASLSYNDYNQLNQVLIGQSSSQLTWLYRQFDEYGRITNSIDRNGVITTNSFDKIGRMLDRRTLGADLAVQSGLETFEYNARGLTNYTDPSGNITRFVRDVVGQVLYQTNGNIECLQFFYDASGNLTNLVDGKGQSTTWTYDLYGLVTNKVDHNGAEMFRYRFDPNGRLTNRWQAGNITTTYKFDPVGNLTNVAYENSGSIVLGYDYANRLTNMVDRVGTTKFNWTAAAQLAGEDGPWDSDSVSYSYTQRLRTSLGLVQPNASTWSQTYGYDDYWRLGTVTSPAGTFTTQHKEVSASGLGYTASDLVQQLTQPSGAYIYNRFDGLARLLSIGLTNSFGTRLNTHAYEYNNGHQRTKQTFTAGNYVDYTYDAIGQLKTAKGKESSGTTRPQEQFGYAYDKAWNLNYRTNNALTQTFGVNSLNELTTLSQDGTITVAGAVSITPTNVTVKDNNNDSQTATVYSDNSFARENVTRQNGNNTFTAVAQDNYGRSDTNTVTAWLPSSASCYYDVRGNLTNDGRRVFYYDDESQLTTVLVSNAWKSEFVYDGLMRRRLRVESTWNGTGWTTNQMVRYIYDGRSVLQERLYVSAGATLIPQNAVTYTRGNDLSGTLEGAGGIGGLLARSDLLSAVASGGGGSLHAYYSCDGNGNITALIDTNQTLVAKYHYDPYGNLLGMAGPMAEANLYRFSSKEVHPRSGLVYYLYRYYEPASQRWVNRDPIKERGGINLYRFVSNRAGSIIDPYGLCGGGEYSLMGMGGPGMANFASPQGVAGLAEALGAANQAGYPADQVLVAASNEDFQQFLDRTFPNDFFLLGGGEFHAGPLDIEGVGLFGMNHKGVYGGGLSAAGAGLLCGYEWTTQTANFDRIWLFDPGLGFGLYQTEHDAGGYFYFPPESPVFIGIGFGFDHGRWTR